MEALSGMHEPSPFVALMRIYCNDYTNRHDTSVCPLIMEPGYTLHMGVHDLVGRDERYTPAAMKQFTQFPGLCLTVNQIVTNGDRLVMRFSEHGASNRHDGRVAAWNGIGLYRWNGKKLLENFVEQDYFSRTVQLDGGDPLPVENPAIAPWDSPAEPENPAAEAFVRGLIESGDILDQPALLFDDEWISGAAGDRVIEPESAVINDIFSAGDHVAFHVAMSGRLRADSVLAGDNAGEKVLLHMGAVVRVEQDELVWGRGVRDRLGLKRRLAQS